MDCTLPCPILNGAWLAEEGDERLRRLWKPWQREGVNGSFRSWLWGLQVRWIVDQSRSPPPLDPGMFRGAPCDCSWLGAVLPARPVSQGESGKAPAFLINPA